MRIVAESRGLVARFRRAVLRSATAPARVLTHRHGDHRFQGGKISDECTLSQLGAGVVPAVLALASFGSAVAQTEPVAGSENVATADPIVAPPPSTPCAVLVLGQT